MDISKAYQESLETHGFTSDPAQEKIVAELQRIQTALIIKENRETTLFHQLRQAITGNKKPVTGLYLWGDVGRGKTWLMNLFMNSLPSEKKIRLHFHHFMIGVHEKLASQSNQKDPLKIIAREFSRRYLVLCLDEFIVTNITDAMLLSGLLDEMFKNGVTLIATSNRIPDDLYKNGLQRERFLPAIELINKHTRAIKLDSNIDHRLELLEQTDIYLTPINGSTHQYLLNHFELLATDRVTPNKILIINKRPIITAYCSDEIAWFTFDALCDSPRATPDYIELARQFHTIILSDVPKMDEYLDDKARRFIYLIDEMYDRSVKVIISAEGTAESLYSGELLEFAFNRTVSRLAEMRSEAYLARCHQLDSVN